MKTFISLNVHVTSALYIRITFLICLVLWRILLNAQDIRFLRITQDQGLSQNSVTAIYQDSRGFMWIGTQDGLNKYDGYEFTVYRNIPSDSTALSNNYIRDIIEDQNGDLWIGTSGGGLCRFDYSNEIFHCFQANDSIPNSIGGNSVMVLYEDKEGQIWCGTRFNGLSVFNPNTNSFMTYSMNPDDDNSLSHYAVNVIVPGMGDDIWIGTNNGISKINTQSGKITRHLNQQDDDTDNVFDIMGIIPETDGSLWLATRGSGLISYKPNEDTYQVFVQNDSDPESISHNFCYYLMADGNDHLWIATFGGLNRFNKKTGKFSRYEYLPENPMSLSSNSVLTMTKDFTGDVWIGTMGGGINIINNDLQEFQLYKSYGNDANIQTITDNSIWSIEEDHNGAIWIATQHGGLNKLNKHNNTFDKNAFPVRVLKEQGQKFNTIVFQDSRDYLWVGTHGQGIFKFDLEKEIFTNYTRSDAEGLHETRVWSMTEDHDGILWMGTEKGLLNYNPNTNTFSKVTDLPTEGSIYWLLTDSRNDVWLCSWGDVIRKINRETGRFDEAFTEQKYSHIKYTSMVSMIEDHQKNIWFGTHNGIIKYNPENGEAMMLTEQDGLPNNLVYGLLQDNQNMVWASTNYGLSMIDPATLSFKNFTKSDGIQGNEFNAGAFTKDSDGLLYFGGTEGLSVFDPKKVVSTPVYPNVALTNFLLFNERQIPTTSTVLKSSIGTADQIKLTHKDYVFAIEFAALAFKKLPDIKYAYRLAPFHEDWIYTDYKDRKAVFTNVPPGEYMFHVKSTNTDGDWIEKTTSLSIIITPPWYWNIWSKVIYTLIFFGTIYIIYYLRTRQLNLQKDSLKRKVKERTIQLQEKNDELARNNVELTRTLSQLEATQDKLILSEKMASVGILSNGVAHELNNPLNFIKGGAEGLKKAFLYKEIDNAQVDKLLEIILEGVNRSTVIIQSLNQFSQQTGSDNDDCDIHKIINNCLEILKNQFKHKVFLFKEFEKSIISVKGNAGKLHQAIINVLQNAEQSMSEPGKIKIITQLEQSFVRVTIEDEGEGIDDDYIKHVTDPFFTTRQPGKGVGLGLYITYNIIHDMGGELVISSLGHGRGTKLDILLPNPKIGESMSLDKQKEVG
ncbi:two-component regulator propeller domain-containing protein [Ekhidna sp.]|uniref:ligand-binding sensor domain-containing protein n=1 Tax=Ekhidna sp. TaxID=2608089 RepID=UPI003297DEB0